MWGYLFAIVGFSTALILLWAVFSKRKSPKPEVTTYICAQCGDHHCVCQKEPPSPGASPVHDRHKEE